MKTKKTKVKPHSRPRKRAARTVTKEMTIGEVVQKYPVAAEIMMERGLHCIGCHVSPFESLEQGALSHGLSGKEVDDMVDEINRAVKTKNGK